jgi:hypothetical protein
MLPFQNLSQSLANQPSGTEVGERAGNQNIKGTRSKIMEFVFRHETLLFLLHSTIRPDV